MAPRLRGLTGKLWSILIYAVFSLKGIKLHKHGLAYGKRIKYMNITIQNVGVHSFSVAGGFCLLLISVQILLSL